MKILFTSIISFLSISATATLSDSFLAAGSTMSVVTQARNNAETVPGSSVSLAVTGRQDIVDFARTLNGIPYLYGSMDPAKGFDCSGFVNYVANHFGYKVPRSSVDFTDLGEEINITDAQKGDIILFTGTDETVRRVGHMGIVTGNNEKLSFIHATSGKAHSVMESEFSSHYEKRFMKVIRLFS